MCGLVGVAGNLILRDLKIFNQMLIADQFRGVHSTGLASVVRGHASVYKRAVNAMDFLQLKKTDELISAQADTLIGHNRYATKGGVSDATAHPFEHGDITLVHNGTLTSMYNLPDSKDFTVDSEAICYAMSVWEPKQVLEELSGAYALVWHDARDNTLNFARNDERTLCIAYAGNNIFWASERKMLEWILDRNDVNNPQYYDLEAGKHVTLELGTKIKDMQSLTYNEFAPKKVSYTGYYGGGNYATGGGDKQRQKKIVDDHARRLSFLGYEEAEEIDFFLTDFVTYSHDSTSGNALGFDITNNQPVVIMNVRRVEVVMGTQGQPSMEVIYTGKVSRPARLHQTATQQKHNGDWVEVSKNTVQWEEITPGASPDVIDHEAIQKALGGEVCEKKPSSQYTEEEYTDTYVDGVLFCAEDIPKTLNDGCAMCGNPLGIVSLRHAKLSDQGEPIHSHVCWQEYQKLMALES